MTVKRQVRSAKFKFKVALEAVKELKTVSQIASDYQVNPGQVSKWKRQLQGQGATIFKTKPDSSQQQQEKKEAELYEQIGRLKMELEWLKKKCRSTHSAETTVGRTRAQADQHSTSMCIAGPQSSQLLLSSSQ